MQHLPTLNVIQRALRQSICTRCFRRPEASERLTPEVPRSCEPECTIFVHLPKLQELAGEIHDPMLAPYEHAMRELICQTSCELSSTPGDYCPERTTMNCPLSHYAADVVEVIERVSEAKSHAESKS